jgi:hypothetical protein
MISENNEEENEGQLSIAICRDYSVYNKQRVSLQVSWWFASPRT